MVFEEALNNNVFLTVSNGNVFNQGDPLPNLGSKYRGNTIDSYNCFFYSIKTDSLDFSLWDTRNIKDMSGFLQV